MYINTDVLLLTGSHIKELEELAESIKGLINIHRENNLVSNI